MKNNSWGIALRIMVNVSGWIAVPIIIGLYLGKWLDHRLGTSPWLFLITMGLAFAISIYGLTVNALKEFKKMDKEAKNQKTDINLKIK